MEGIGLIRDLIREKIKGALKDLGKDYEFKVEIPPEGFGDFSSNVAMVGTRHFKRPPREVAKDLVDRLRGEEFESIEIAGPGFINFRVSKELLQRVVRGVLDKGREFGKKDIGHGLKVQFEYASANPTGPLTVAHGRQIVIGDTLVKLYKELGFDVENEVYLNDAGRQISLLAYSLWVRYNELFGIENEIPEDGYRGEYLVDVARKLKDEIGDKYKGVWNDEVEAFFKDYAVNEMLRWMKKTFEKMGSSFDNYFSERSLIEDGTVNEILKYFKEKNLVYEKDGALWLKVSEFIDEDDKVLIRKDGTPTYFMTDIAYHYNKKMRGFDRVYDIWGSDHHGHIPRMKVAMKALGFPDDFLTVILHQFVTLKKGGKKLRMSTRAGRFITLDELLEEVGRDATRYFFARIDPSKPLDFDIDLALKQSSDNPVYYVQYAHARISSLFRQAKEKGIEFKNLENVDLLSNDHEREVMKRLDTFEDVLLEAALYYLPSRITSYLEDLAHSFHMFYTHNTILDSSNPDLSNARLNLSKAVQIVIRKGLSILGVSAPERM